MSNLSFDQLEEKLKLLERKADLQRRARKVGLCWACGEKGELFWMYDLLFVICRRSSCTQYVALSSHWTRRMINWFKKI